jgi:hypothetical protein
MASVIKYALWVLAAVALAAGLSLGLLSTGALNNRIVEYLSTRLSNEMGSPVRLGRLTGNPLSHFKISRLSIGEAERPLFEAEALEIDIRFLALLKGDLDVYKIRILEPILSLGKSGSVGSLWDQAASPFDLNIRSAEILGGEIRIAKPEYEKVMRNVEMVFAFSSSHTGFDLELFRFKSAVFSPALKISNLSGVSWLRDGSVGVENLRVGTERSRIELNGSVSGFTKPHLALSFKADPLSSEDIRTLVSAPIPNGNWSVDGTLSGTTDHLELAADIRGKESEARVEGFVDFSEDFACSLQVSAAGIDLSLLYPDMGLNAGMNFLATIQAYEQEGIRKGRVNAEISKGYAEGFSVPAGVVEMELEGRELFTRATLHVGKGTINVNSTLEVGVPFTRKTLNSHWEGLDLSVLVPGVEPGLGGKLILRAAGDENWALSGNLDGLVSSSFSLPHVTFSGVFAEGNLRLDQFSGRLSDGFGTVSGRGDIHLGGLWLAGTGEPSYALNVAMEGVDPGRITGDERWTGAFSLEGTLEGTGYSDTATWNTDLRLVSSDFMGVGIDSGRVLIRLLDRQLLIDRMVASGPFLRLEAGGKIEEDGHLAGRVRARIQDPSILEDFLPTEVSGLPVDLIGVLEGTWSQPEFAIDVVSESLSIAGIPMHGLKASTRWPVLSSGAVSVSVDSVGWAGRQLTGVFLQASQTDDDLAFLIGNSPEDSHRFYLWGKVGFAGGRTTVELDSLSIKAGRVELTNEGRCRFSYHADDGLQVDWFRLSGESGHIEAKVMPDRRNTILVEISSVDLAIWSFVLGIEQEVEGIFSGELEMENVQGEPNLDLSLVVDSGHFAGVRFKGLSGKVNYRQGYLEGALTLVQSSGDPVKVSGKFPISGTGEGQDERIDLIVESNRLNLEFIPMISPEIDTARGEMQLMVKVQGTPDSPEYMGHFRVENAMLGVVSLNRVFNPIHIKGRITTSGVFLDSARVGDRRKGMVLDGFVGYGQVGQGELDLRVTSRAFELVDLEDLSASLDMDLQLGGTFAAPTIHGNAELKRAVFQLYSFIETPLDPESFWIASPFMQKLVGKVRVNADRNVWIRDRNINVETEGDVDVIKNEEGYRLFGLLNSRRGRYEFQQTNFRIQRGELQFQGILGVNPDLYILGTHNISLYDGEPAVVSVVVGGTLLNPQISLDSDPPLTERDILSYLVTGHSAEDVGALLSGGEVAGTSLEGQAAGLVLGVAANQLRATIGRKLDLDIVEIDMGGEGRSTRIRVGKYIGSRFFFTYSRELSSAGEQEFTVEYELVPSVTLEAQQREGTEQQRDRQSLGIFWNKEW